MQKLILLFLIFGNIGLLAQQTDDKENILKGKVLQHSFEVNTTEFPPIAEAEIKAGFASPTLSLSNGDYELVFHKMQAGEAVALNVYKDGYEVVNEDDLITKVPKYANKQLLKIFLAPRGKIDEHKIVYYNISLKIITEVYESQIAALNRRQEGWEQERNRIEEDYQRQLQHARKLAEKFARTIFADVGELYKKAFSLYQEGKIDEALRILDEANLIGRAEQRIKEGQLIVSLSAAHEQGKKDDMEAIILAIELHNLKYEYEEVEALFEKLWLLDTTNIKNTYDYAQFLDNINHYDKALSFYQKIIQSVKSEQWHKGRSHEGSGDIYIEIGKLPQAISSYEEGLKIYEKLHDETPKDISYAIDVTLLYSLLGNCYRDQGDFYKALEYYMRDYKLTKKLCEENPGNEGLRYGLAECYRNVGKMYLMLPNLDKALEYFALEAKHLVELCSEFPEVDELFINLYQSYGRIGDVYQVKGDYEGALKYYILENDLAKKDFESDSQSIDKKYELAVSYAKLGEAYVELDHLDKALEYFSLDNKLTKEIYDVNPRNVHIKNGLAISYERLGYTYQKLEDYNMALEYYTLDNILTQELYKTNPKNIDYYSGLGVSFYWLAKINQELEKNDGAINYYKLAAKILDDCNRILRTKKYMNVVTEAEKQLLELEKNIKE